MSEPITLIATFTAKAGRSEELGAVLAAMVEPSRAEEGCINYDLHRSTENPDVWVFYENWRSPEGLEVHHNTPHFRRLQEQAPGLTAGETGRQLLRMVSPRAPHRA